MILFLLLFKIKTVGFEETKVAHWRKLWATLVFHINIITSSDSENWNNISLWLTSPSAAAVVIPFPRLFNKPKQSALHPPPYDDVTSVCLSRTFFVTCCQCMLFLSFLVPEESLASASFFHVPFARYSRYERRKGRETCPRVGRWNKKWIAGIVSGGKRPITCDEWDLLTGSDVLGGPC